MNITVKAAHCFVTGYRYQHLVFNAVIKRLDELPLAPVISFLQEPDFELPNCSRKHQSLIEECHIRGQRLRRNSPSVTLRGGPKLTVGALKSLQELEPWIPKENLVLLKRKRRPLEDDNATLSECGFKGRGGSLLACMGGSFTLTLDHVYASKKFDILVSSCFVTVGDLKKKILYATGILPEKQSPNYNSSGIPKKEKTPLVALGMVKPYSTEMAKHFKYYSFVPSSVDADIAKHLNNIRLYNIPI